MTAVRHARKSRRTMVKCANKMRKQVKEEERKMKKSLCLMLVICMLCSTLQTVTVSFAGAAKAEASQSNTGALEAFKQNYEVQDGCETETVFDTEAVMRKYEACEVNAEDDSASSQAVSMHALSDSNDAGEAEVNRDALEDFKQNYNQQGSYETDGVFEIDTFMNQYEACGMRAEDERISSKMISEHAVSYYTGTNIPTYTSITGWPVKYVSDEEEAGVISYVYFYYLDADDLIYYCEVLEESYGWQAYDATEKSGVYFFFFVKNGQMVTVVADTTEGLAGVMFEVASSVAPTSVSLNVTKKTLNVGQQFTLTATVNPSNASNKSVTWSSSNTSVATVSSTGVVKAVAKGTATITAKTSNGKKATCTITVEKKTVTYYSDTDIPTYTFVTGYEMLTMVDNEEDDGSIHYTYFYNLNSEAVISYCDYLEQECGWQAYDATENEGVYFFFFVKNGQMVTVVADTTEGLAGVMFEVTSSIQPTSISLNASKRTMIVGNQFHMTATVSPSNATNKNVTWSTSKASVATVSSSGLVTAVGAGTATITATTANGKKATCAITVKKLTLEYYPNTIIPTYTCITGVSQTDMEVTEEGSYVHMYPLDVDFHTDYEAYLVNKDGWRMIEEKIASDKSYAMVSYGKGDTIVVVCAEFSTGKTMIAYVNYVDVTGVSLNKSSAEMEIGEKMTLIATVSPSNATNKNVRWVSSNPSVATVSDTGVVTAIAEGVADIAVTTEGDTYVAYCTIYVVKKSFSGLSFSDKKYTYDGRAKSLAVSGTLPSGAVVQYQNETATDAGTYNATATITADGYNTLTLHATLTIAPKELTVIGLTAENKTYDGTDAAVVSGGILSGIFSGDEISIVFPTTGRFAKAAAGTSISVAIDPLVLAGADKDNYTLSQPALKANITAAPLKIEADDYTIKVGDAIPALTYVITEGQLFGSDTLTGALATTANGSKAGSFSITQGTLKANANYAITFKAGTLTVLDKTPQNIVVSQITEKTYGDADFQVTVTPDAVSGLTDFTFTSSNTDVAEIDEVGNITIKAAGTTTITVRQAGDADYAAFEKKQTLTVKKVAIVVTADNKTKRIGAEDPELTFTYTGTLVGNDSFSGALSRKSGERIGKYDILQGTLKLSDNYSLTYKKGVFEIVDKTPQNIEVSQITEKTYGDADFQVTVTPDAVSGLTDFTFTSSNTDVAEIDEVGNITIKAAGTTTITVRQAGDADYAAFEKKQTLTVKKVAIVVTADNKTKRIGAEDPELTFTYTGTLVGNDSFSGALSRKSGERIGKYDILQGTLKLSDNYSLTYKKGVFEIVEKTPQTIVVADFPEMTYGDASFAIVVTPDSNSYLSAFTFESANTEVADITADGTVNIKAAGTVDITVKQAGNEDYAPVEVKKTLVINKKSVTVVSINTEEKMAVLDGVLAADTDVALDFNRVNITVNSPVDETTSNVTFSNFVLTGEKAENYRVETQGIDGVLANANIVKVTITADNGTVTGGGQYIKGSNVVVNVVANKGYSFIGWSIADTAVSSEATYTFTADADTELVAKFKKRSTGGGGGGGGGAVAGNTKYIVSFDTNGGSVVDSQSVAINGKATQPENPVKTGYVFAGWFTDAELKNAFDFKAKVTKNMTLYAKWTEEENKAENNTIILAIGEKMATVFGVEKMNDVAPEIANDRTMLPARFVAENLGAVVAWEATALGVVTITKDDLQIILYIGKDYAVVNGQEVLLDSPAYIKDNRTYTPVRFIAEQLGATVTWDAETQKVMITK